VDSPRPADAITPELAMAARLARIVSSTDRPAPATPQAAERTSETAPPELAFAARLVPTAASGTPSPAATASDPPVAPSTTVETNRAPALTAAAAEKPLAQTPARKASAAPDASATAEARLQQPDTSARFAPAVEPAIERGKPDGAASPSPAVLQPQSAEASPEAAKPAPAAREIKLQLNGGEQRVEVRLVERGGDVHVAVRTADTRLAGALREDLPALSARLEESGFRAETWHTGLAAPQDRQTTLETAVGATPQGQQNRSGQDRNNQQQDGRQQPPKDQQNPQRKDDRKDFAWLFTSLR
jgi:hypothetical protein